MGPWLLDWELGYYKSYLAQAVALTLLGGIQALNLFWLWFIIRVAVRFVVKKEAVDERSEGEESAGEEEERSDG